MLPALAWCGAIHAGTVEPEKAAKAISRAIAACRPGTRITVGREAAIMTRMADFAPDLLLGRVLRRRMHLH